MDRKLFTAFASATVVGFAYTIRRLIQAEKRHDIMCDVMIEQHETYAQHYADIAFENIVEHFDD